MYNQYRKSSDTDNWYYTITMDNEIDLDAIYAIIEFHDSMSETSDNPFAIAHLVILTGFELEDIYYVADAISGDLEYVASALRAYSKDIIFLGSTAILDEMKIIREPRAQDSRIILIRNLLEQIADAFRILGTGCILFMTKALMLQADNSTRRELINELIKTSYIPISQDETDVVLAKSLAFT